jgi:sulfide dehydrogenase cytochrome subunit
MPAGMTTIQPDRNHHSLQQQGDTTMQKPDVSVKRAFGILIGTAMFLSAPVIQAQEISRGAIIATTCYTCHGTYGVSPGTIPSINDLSMERITTMLKEFRSGQRVSTVMGRHASGYTDAEIAEVALYFSKLPKGGK